MQYCIHTTRQCLRIHKHHWVLLHPLSPPYKLVFNMILAYGSSTYLICTKTFPLLRTQQRSREVTTIHNYGIAKYIQLKVIMWSCTQTYTWLFMCVRVCVPVWEDSRLLRCCSCDGAWCKRGCRWRLQNCLCMVRTIAPRQKERELETDRQRQADR